MRPIRLEMKNFGPYAGTPEPIDFERLGSGIFVITGETGTGKTTIFDAIMFALFEEVSAKPISQKEGKALEAGSSRDKLMLHSDFVDKSEDTEVTLIFEEDGKTYKVKRTMHFSKKRSGGFNAPTFDAELTGDDMDPVTRSGAVNDKIVSILHMESTKFRQIVMLAQGEFKAFLESKDDSRKDILSGIFDSTPYKLFQEKLKEAYDNIEKKSKEAEGKIARVLSDGTFVIPEGEDENLYAPNNPELEKNLLALLEKDAANIQLLEEEREKHDVRESTLNVRLGQEMERLKKLDEKKTKTERLGSLEAQAESYADRRTVKDRVAVAFRVVKPVADKYEGAKANEEKAKVKLKNLQEALVSSKDRVKKAEAELSLSDERKAKMSALAKDAEYIAEHLSDLDTLAERQLEANGLTERILDNEKSIQTLSEGIASSEESIQKIREELSRMADLDSSFVEAKAEVARTAQRLSKCTEGDDSILSVRLRLLKEEEDLVALSQKALSALKDKSAKEQEADEKNRLYLEGYAGILSGNLSSEIERKGSGICPVCGTVHRKLSEDFAKPMDHLPTEEEVKNAKEAARKAADTSAGLNDEFTSRNARFSSEKENLLARVGELFPTDAWDWSALKEECWAKAIKESVEKASGEAEEIYEALDVALKNRKVLSEKADGLASLKERSTVERNTKEKEQSGLTERLNAVKNDIGRLEAVFGDKYSSSDEAKKAMDAFQEECKVLDAAIRAAEDSHKAATTVFATLDGQVKEGYENLAEVSCVTREAEMLFRGTLSDNGFDYPDYTDCLQIGSEGEAWISREEAAIRDYETEKAILRQNLEELSKEDLEDICIDEIKEELLSVGNEKREVQSEINSLKIKESGHQMALQTLQEVGKELMVINKATARLKRLSEVANGSNADGGKRAFDGYILSSTFQEVLENATGYLLEMTGGKYQILHDEEAKDAHRSSSTNFRIQILDTITGLAREVGSLSGGESFQVSMALALGLSDTVQNHASTVKIDTMFIDEGFGSLDQESLSRMLSVLSGLSGGRRQIGIISHIDALEESASKFIRVKGGSNRGSSLTVEY